MFVSFVVQTFITYVLGIEIIGNKELNCFKSIYVRKKFMQHTFFI